MNLPCTKVALRILHRDTAAEVGTIVPSSIRWTSDKGEAGALGFTIDTQAAELIASPALLDDRVAAVITNLDPAAPDTMTEVAWYLVNPGQVAVVQSKHPTTTADVTPTNRGLLAMLDDWVVVHDGGQVRKLGGDTRYVGWMSQQYQWAGRGFALVGPAQAEPWATDSTARGLTPEGPYPRIFADVPESEQLSWIANTDPTANEPVGARHALVGSFQCSGPTNAVIYAAADNYITLWLDGQLVYQQDEKGDSAGWNEIQQPFKIALETGSHYVAILAQNKVGVNNTQNPVGAVCGIYAVDSAGSPAALLYQTGADFDASLGAASPSGNQWLRRDASQIIGVTAGWIFRTLLNDARAGFMPRSLGGQATRSAGLIGTTFTDQLDTAGVAWPEIGGEIGAIALPIGTTGTELVERLSAFGFVARMRPAVGAETTTAKWMVDAWVDPGADKSATVTLRGNTNLGGYEVDATGVVATTLLVRHDEGWLLVGDPAAEGLYGSRIASLESGLSLDPTAAEKAARANLPSLTRIVQSATATVVAGAPTGTGPRPYADFTVADTVSGLDRFRAPVALEVVSIAGTWTGEGDSTVVRFDIALKEPA